MLSLGILAKGLSESLRKLLVSFSSEFDEVIIVNNVESKEIKNLEKDFPNLKVYFLKELDFSRLRNFILEKAKGEWILFLDEDEKIKKDFLKKIREVIKSQNKVAFYLPRVEIFLGKEVKYGEVLKQRTKGIIRLVKKGGGYWKGRVHEKFIPQGKVGKIEAPILHYSHSSVSDFLKKINFYSSLRAKELLEKGKKFSFLELIFFPVFKFLYTYFILFGFLDGYRGFVYSFMMAFHSFLVRAKLYQYKNFES